MGSGDPSANSLRPAVLNDPDSDFISASVITRRTLVRDESSEAAFERASDELGAEANELQQFIKARRD